VNREEIRQGAEELGVELAEQYNIMGCFECGSCAYICPANIPIVQLIRTGKAEVMAAAKK
jgi:electron transport complex protein RnfC